MFIWSNLHSLAGAPEKLKFLKGPLNIVDILAILPYYLSLAFTEEVGIRLDFIFSFNISVGKPVPTGGDRATNGDRDDNANVRSGRGGNQL